TAYPQGQSNKLPRSLALSEPNSPLSQGNASYIVQSRVEKEILRASMKVTLAISLPFWQP
ncbi:MAG TPA: hypothetical protein VKK81_00425, partial [Candidatus Binatia bacterium]|nr:hypothetical protein [Candidatus Binatia bacterium]